MPKAIPVSALSATRNWTHGSELSGLTAQRKKVRQISKKDQVFCRYEKLTRAAKRERKLNKCHTKTLYGAQERYTAPTAAS